MLGVGRQGREIAQAVEDPDIVVAEDAQALAGDDGQPRLVAVTLEPVAAIPKESEVVVVQPQQEVARLADLVIRQRVRHVIDEVQDAQHGCSHRLPVLDREADIGQHLLDALRHLLQQFRRRLLVHLDMHEGFGHRVGGGGLGLVQVGQMPGGVAAHPHHGMDRPRWTVRPCRFSSHVTESTRNGMSSLTISTTVWPLCQPCSSSWGW